MERDTRTGLKGDAIPLGARILSGVDAYVAMTDARPYRPARSSDEAVAELRRAAGTQFDPRVVETFHQVIARGVALEVLPSAFGLTAATLDPML